MTGAASTLGEALKLFTQCAKCETVFKLSAEVLRAAGGQVRCGKCGEVFSALARLAEDAAAFQTGESSLDLETRANRILETVVPPQVAQAMAKDYEEFTAPDVEIARLEILDWNEDEEDPAQPQETDARDAGVADSGAEGDDRSMEFTLPPGELDRIFVASPVPAPAPQASCPSAPLSVPPSAPQSSHPSVPTPEPPPAPHEAIVEFESEPAPHPESALVAAPPTRDRVTGFEVPEDVRRDMLAGFEQHILTVDVAPDAAHRSAHRRPLILWLGAAIISSLLLMAQVVHQNREWFVAQAHGPFGAIVRALYGALGNPLPQPARLSAYELRQWGVTGDPDANGTLRVRASILNTAAQLQPYPLLRVTLADRFGVRLGRRDFEPSEYLGKPNLRLLAPGERVDATLAILDPGKSAEGFEVDVCLRAVDQRIACANDATPQIKR